MNFLCLASAFLLFQMGLGSWIGCSVKAVGGVLFVIGLRELRDVCNIQSKGAANAGGELPVRARAICCWDVLCRVLCKVSRRIKSWASMPCVKL